MFSSERVLPQGLRVPKRSGGLHIPPLHGAIYSTTTARTDGLCRAATKRRGGVDALLSLDYTFSAQQRQGRHGEIKGICSLQIDYQGKARGLLYGNIGWPASF
jgi:hypothetical protein